MADRESYANIRDYIVERKKFFHGRETGGRLVALTIAAERGMNMERRDVQNPCRMFTRCTAFGADATPASSGTWVSARSGGEKLKHPMASSHAVGGDCTTSPTERLRSNVGPWSVSDFFDGLGCAVWIRQVCRCAPAATRRGGSLSSLAATAPQVLLLQRAAAR